MIPKMNVNPCTDSIALFDCLSERLGPGEELPGQTSRWRSRESMTCAPLPPHLLCRPPDQELLGPQSSIIPKATARVNRMTADDSTPFFFFFCRGYQNLFFQIKRRAPPAYFPTLVFVAGAISRAECTPSEEPALLAIQGNSRRMGGFTQD